MPPRDIRAYLADVLAASGLIARMIEALDYEGYRSNVEKRSAVERQLLTVGEAIAQLRKHHPDVAGALTDVDRIVAFRNILVHGYFMVRDDIVWEIVRVHLPTLNAQIAALMSRYGMSP